MRVILSNVIHYTPFRFGIEVEIFLVLYFLIWDNDIITIYLAKTIFVVTKLLGGGISWIFLVLRNH